jgi:hypothetical protein
MPPVAREDVTAALSRRAFSAGRRRDVCAFGRDRFPFSKPEVKHARDYAVTIG